MYFILCMKALRENTSNSKSNILRQHKEHKKFAFIIGDTIVKDVDGYLLTGSVNIKFIAKVRLFLSGKPLDMRDYIKPTERDFSPSLYIIHIDTNDLFLEDIPKIISKRIIKTAERG